MGVSAISRSILNPCWERRFSCLALTPWSVLVLLLCLPGSTIAQTTGDEAELDRLKIKAEEAISNEDAEGAAMAMGRAALMAAHLAKKQTDVVRMRLFRGVEHLSRSQEHGYRAMALFRRAGGTLPASAGVCSSLRLGQLELEHAKASVDESAPPADADRVSTARVAQLVQGTDEWSTVLAAMQSDYECLQ